jgi:hypothetical protein
MERRLNAGSIQAVANYMRAADESGHRIALYGQDDPAYPELCFSTEIDAFDYVVFLIEARLEWMSGLRLPRIVDNMPRERRAVLDTDGVYNQTICVDDYDRNHVAETERSKWLTSMDWLGGKIFQPTLEPHEPGVLGLPFYGYAPGARIQVQPAESKSFDIMHVGHNWWRWREMSKCLLPAIERIRPQVGEVCFVGMWWDATPPWAAALKLETAFCVDPGRLQQLRIRVKQPVPYTQVIPTMSSARVNIMTQRPLFRHLKLLTSKYFEIFCADTIPLVMLAPDHAESIYGPAGREIALLDGTADKLLDVLSRPQRYAEIVEAVRQHLAAHHSYQRRVEELVAALEA